jgi:hypothetical protein
VEFKQYFVFQKYQSSLTSEFKIERADAKALLVETAKKIGNIFEKNKVALKVRIRLRGLFSCKMIRGAIYEGGIVCHY